MKAALLLTLGLTLLARPARADEACLTGGSTLGDQRDLASLAAAIETACPCASFTGGPGLDRKAYRRCAKEERDLAAAGGHLRAKCRSAATRDYSEATCGTALVACGRVTPSSAKRPLGCKVEAATKCADGKKSEANVCGNETHCSDVLDFTASTCVDMRDNGPFGVGAMVITYTKPSAVNPANTRTLDTVIWYPTSPGASPISPQYQAVLDAPLDDSGGPYPLLLFSHGSCGFPLQSTFLLPMIASYGFIVAAPPHPGNTINDFPSCGSGPAQAASFVERPKDMSFVLDQLLLANADSGSPFFGAIDPSKVGMSGHSFGGLTTYYVAAADARIKVAIPMAPAVVGNPPLEVPSLTMLGQIDSVVDDPSIRNQYVAAETPKFKVEIAHAGHYAFSDGCFPSPDCNPPTTLTQPEAHQAVLRFVLPFLETYLVGDASFAPFLLPGGVPPGVSFDAQP
jgi:dienelactone hydrolase